MVDCVAWYNECHHHSGIGLHTPSQVHHGRHRAIDTRREATLTAARTAHPERFDTARAGLPKILRVPDQVWINEPDDPNPEQDQQAA